MKLYIFKAYQQEGVYLTPLFSMTNTPYPSPMEQCVGGPAENYAYIQVYIFLYTFMKVYIVNNYF